MHHPDYSRPLLVIWMCHDCHCELHQWDESISLAAGLRRQVESLPDWRREMLAMLAERCQSPADRLRSVIRNLPLSRVEFTAVGPGSMYLRNAAQIAFGLF